MLPVYIPSRQRPENMPRMLSMFPEAVVCVAEEEAETYRAAGAERLLLHPDDLVGAARIMRWALQHPDVPDTFVWADDDIIEMQILTGIRKRPTRDPETIAAVFDNSAQCARDAGTGMFGFSREWDLRKYEPYLPFTLRGWADTVFGFVGRGVLPKDRARIIGGDVDLYLRALCKWRFVWIDNRFSFAHERYGGVGGNAVLRSKAQMASDLEDLKRDWQGAVRFDKGRRTLYLTKELRIAGGYGDVRNRRSGGRAN